MEVPSSAMARPAVLLVSGDADSAEMYAVGLSLGGFQPIVVGDAPSMRSGLAAHVPEAVVVDFTAGWQMGWELLAELRSRKDTRHTPVVLLADGREEPVRARAEASACTAVLAKPCLPDALVGAVRNALRMPPGATTADGNLFRHL
jgi:DNA-binding response OmpR family regulator